MTAQERADLAVLQDQMRRTNSDVGEIKGRYIRIQQVGTEPGIPWWIAELNVRAPATAAGHP